jgi:lipid II:glycine glycyltransferase (peptidoglycan interpeptide bridge formation enzyme)
LLAYADSKAVAGEVFLNWNRILTYKFSASDPAHWPSRPNHALLWHAIRRGCENGYRLFDWGKDLDDTGLRTFTILRPWMILPGIAPT